MTHKSRRQFPHNLPGALTYYAEKFEQTGVPIDVLYEFINAHERAFIRYGYLENLYRGFLGMLTEEEKESWKPDNRLAVNFPRYMTETFTGYGYGIPIAETSSEENINKAMQTFIESNEMPDHEIEMAKLCCIYGHAWEYLYQDEETETKITAFNPKEVFCVYDDTLKSRALFAVRYGYHRLNGGPASVRYGEVLTRDRIYTFDNEKYTGERINPYGYIPVVEWKLNEERIGLYEDAAALIESFSHTISEKANDVDAFAEAYLAILGAEVDDDGVRRIRDNRIINVYGTDDAKEIIVQFLTKPTADGTQENLLQREEDLIYRTSMVANISDETFGSATSGKALKFKVWAMSNLAQTFDNKIQKSLKKRYKIWSALSTNTSDPNAWKTMSFKFSRNIPDTMDDMKDEADVAVKLKDLVSDKTLLGVLKSLVPDPDAELAKIADQTASAENSLIDRLMQQSSTPAEE